MKNRKIYIRLLVTYLLIFLFPMLINVLILEDIAVSTKDSICQNVVVNLTHSKDILDDNFRGVNRIIDNLTSNSNIRYLAVQMSESSKKVEISKLIMARDYMNANLNPTFADEFYVYFHDPKMIISPGKIFLNDDGGRYFFQYHDMSWADWMQLQSTTKTPYFLPEAKTKINFNESDMFLYMQPLVTSLGVIKGTFVFPIQSESVRKLVTGAFVADAGWVYILDRTGQLILTIPSKNGEMELIPEDLLNEKESISHIEFQGRKLAVIKVKSEYMGLTYVTVLSNDYITAQINTQQQNLIRIICGVAVLGLGCVLLISWHRGRRMNSILSLFFSVGVDDYHLKEDELAYISNSLKQLIDRNDGLREKIKKQEPITRGLLLERLLRGGAEEGIKQSLENHGIYLQNKQKMVIAILYVERDETATLFSAEESVIYKQLLEGELRGILHQEMHICDIDINLSAGIGVLQTERDIAEADYMAPLEEMCRRFRNEYGVQVRIAISHVFRDLTGVGRAYDQVCEMLRYSNLSQKTVLSNQDFQKSAEYYYYPVSLEERLINAVRVGNVEGLHIQLREIYQVNVLDRNLNPTMMHFLVNDLQCTVYKILHEVGKQVQISEQLIFQQLEELNHENDILLRFNRINGIFKDIGRQVKAENQENTRQLEEKIAAYIKENYANYDMSLTKTAEDFGYASTYFSKLFKDLFHENFAAYLERIRIEEVCLLLNGNETLEKIADKTGYNSVYVLRTAFKRMKNITPNEYRKLYNDKES